MSEAVATAPREQTETRTRVHPLSDELLSRAIDDLCLTASRANVNLSALLDTLPELVRLTGGSAAALVRVVERMQKTSTGVDTVTRRLENRFPDIDEQDRDARKRLTELNAETAARFKERQT